MSKQQNGDRLGRSWFHWFRGLYDVRSRDWTETEAKLRDQISALKKGLREAVADADRATKFSERAKQQHEIDHEGMQVEIRQLKAEVEVLSYEKKLMAELVENYRLMVEASKANSSASIAAAQVRGK